MTESPASPPHPARNVVLCLVFNCFGRTDLSPKGRGEFLLFCSLFGAIRVNRTAVAQPRGVGNAGPMIATGLATGLDCHCPAVRV